jgi:hypothetical protein
VKSDAPINLKRFVPKKAAYSYLLKIAVYVTFLIGIVLFLQYKLGKIKPSSIKSPSAPMEIEGVKIEKPEK